MIRRTLLQAFQVRLKDKRAIVLLGAGLIGRTTFIEELTRELLSGVNFTGELPDGATFSPSFIPPVWQTLAILTT